MKRFVGMKLMLALACATVVGSASNAFATLSLAVNDLVTTSSYTGPVNDGTSTGTVTTGSGTFASNQGGRFHFIASSLNGGSIVGDNDFYAMCIELTQNAAQVSNFKAIIPEDAPNPGTNLPNTSGMGTLAANKIGWLWKSLLTTDLTDLNAEQTSALQLATWALVYNGTLGGSGNAFNLATTYLANVANATLVGDERKYLLALSSPVPGGPDDAIQDMLVFIPNGRPNVDAVPEPATIIVWSLIGGIGAVLGTRRYRTQMLAA